VSSLKSQVKSEVSSLSALRDGERRPTAGPEYTFLNYGNVSDARWGAELAHAGPTKVGPYDSEYVIVIANRHEEIGEAATWTVIIVAQ